MLKNTQYIDFTESDSETETPQAPQTPQTPIDYDSMMVRPFYPTGDFMDILGVRDFDKEYHSHNSINSLDFDLLHKQLPNSKPTGIRPVLTYSKDGKSNIITQTPNGKGWFNVKGTLASIGAFHKADKKSTTLILCQGFIHGINANIAFPTADILVSNTTNSPLPFNHHNIDLKDYRLVVFASNKGDESKAIKIIPFEYKEHFKKIRFINWADFENGSTLTDFINKYISPTLTTKRSRTKKAIVTLKGWLREETLETDYKRLRADEGIKSLSTAISSDNLPMAMNSIKTINMFGGDLGTALKYYINKQNEVKSANSSIINLDKSNRLSLHAPLIVDALNSTSKTFLNAPTGTGKSYTSLVELPKVYKNIVIVSPLRMVTNEHSTEKGSPYIDIRVNKGKYDETEADLFAPYISVTTDVFVSLQDNYEDSFETRLGLADLIIFDEQHLYYDSLGFRDKTVVRCYEHLLYKHKGKVLFMSGTPILPKNIDVSLVTAKVLEENKEIINYSYNPFKDESEIIKSVISDTKKGSVLMYVNSRTKVAELENLLLGRGFDILSITSIEYKKNAEKVEDTILTNDLGHIVYISTTKATTGVNLKHLRAIYQYGTPYTPNTFIQLMARLRKGGNYYVIEPTYKLLREEYHAQKAIGLIQAFKKLKVSNLASAYMDSSFNHWMKTFVLLPHASKNLEGFMRAYYKALTLLESKGFGFFNESKSDFNFISKNMEGYTEEFLNEDSNTFRKFIEQILIDWAVRNDVEALNNLYNLSYKIVKSSVEPSTETHHLITDEDKKAKAEMRKDDRESIEALYIELDKKLEPTGLKCKKLKKNGFSDTELSRLNDIKLHIDKIAKLSRDEHKMTALKFHNVPKKAIFTVVNTMLTVENMVSIDGVSNLLQTQFITNSSVKSPYKKLLLELFGDGFFNDSYISFHKRTKDTEGRTKRNVLTISKEHKKEFNAMLEKSNRKAYLERELTTNAKRILLESFKSYTTERLKNIVSGREESVYLTETLQEVLKLREDG